MKNKTIGCYGIFIKEGKVLLILKNGGPYDQQLDLPGGQFQFGERPLETLKREIQEEVGVLVKDVELMDVDSVFFKWHQENQIISVHHIGIFYKILSYEGEIQERIEISSQNDDSMGAKFYDISTLKKNKLSKLVILELEKLGYLKQ